MQLLGGFKLDSLGLGFILISAAATLLTVT
jgi:hypothetical protein